MQAALQYSMAITRRIRNPGDSCGCISSSMSISRSCNSSASSNSHKTLALQGYPVDNQIQEQVVTITAAAPGSTQAHLQTDQAYEQSKPFSLLLLDDTVSTITKHLKSRLEVAVKSQILRGHFQTFLWCPHHNE